MAAPKLWNLLLSEIHLSSSITVFFQVKTFLFCLELSHSPAFLFNFLANILDVYINICFNVSDASPCQGPRLGGKLTYIYLYQLAIEWA